MMLGAKETGYREPAVTLQLALEHGLTEEEYGRIVEILGRVPTYTELGMYSVMWSEHCSYKNSIAMLKTLPRSGGSLLLGAGEENAGLVDIGDGLAVAFKIESHNHPSAIEPYQGAATGVGGIMRDIFTMGARPIAALNSLRFGNLQDERVRYLFKGVVKGISDYGNSLGIPTVGGEIYFDDSYRENPLVNVMAVGIVAKSKIARAAARGVGNLVMIVGSPTGRDGIHGATFASEELSEGSHERRPSVQVGDPFTEKLLMEAILEAIDCGLVVAVQDMGAAGITCSTTEMCARGGVGMDIDLDKVPLRESHMNSYEIMLSESQERMLLVIKKNDETAIAKIFDKWDLPAAVIGEIVAGDRVNVYHAGKLVASVPAPSLVLGYGAPVYERDYRTPSYIERSRTFDPEAELPVPGDLKKVLMDLLETPTISQKRWVYEQYDSMVRTNTIVNAAADGAVLRIKEINKAFAVKTDCNPRYVYLNPRRGGQIAVCESARNVVCLGARPVAITNCLNFGNPYDSEVFWQFREAVLGIGEACRMLETPVTGGNVSFYNEGPDGAVLPTPVIGMLGLLPDPQRIMTPSFKRPGDRIILLGRTRGEVGGSEYLFQRTGRITGNAPSIDLNYERRLQALCLDLIAKQYIHSAHDISDGGLAVALCESCFASDETLLGARLVLPQSDVRDDFFLFGEDQSRIVVSAEPETAAVIQQLADECKIDAVDLGEVIDEPVLDVLGVFRLDLVEGRRRYQGGLEKMLMGNGLLQ